MRAGPSHAPLGLTGSYGMLKCTADDSKSQVATRVEQLNVAGEQKSSEHTSFYRRLTAVESEREVEFDDLTQN